MTPDESRQLRALVASAWPDRHDSERSRAHAEGILLWHDLRALATIDLHAMRNGGARGRRRRSSAQRIDRDVGALVALLRRTAA